MAEQIRIGAAEAVITPPLGVSMAGYFRDRRADDVLDDLYARAVVFRAGDQAAALVVCDLIGLESEDTGAVRKEIERRTGIPAAHVMICCTHTHTGPVLTARPSLEMYPDEAYMAVLRRKLSDVVQLADQRKSPASLRAGSGHVEGIAFNRRYWMKDGTLRTNPPYKSEEIARRAGPIDPELGMLLVSDEAGRPVALVNVYALHPDEIGGTGFSADYGGVESRILKQVLDASCVVACPNGCCGDINHIDFISGDDRFRHGVMAAERSGSTLAGEAIRQLVSLWPVEEPVLAAGSQSLQAQLRVPDDEELAWAEMMVKNEMDGGFDVHGLDIVAAHRMLAIKGLGLSEMTLEVSAITVGDVALVGLPGEIFVELGLAIKDGSPFPRTQVMELCNATPGYVPTEKAYGEGGYEATNSRFQPGTGEALVEAAVELLNRLAH
jgi:hypothetical protein